MSPRSARVGRTACASFAGVALVGWSAAAPAVDFAVGPANAELLLAAGAQGATFEDPRDGARGEDGDFNWAARLDVEWITDRGLTLGLRAEVDDGGRRSEELNRDELYVYAAGSFGRVEVGEQDGPADVMSFHAPVLALGQVRGDFARYAGSVASLSPADTADSFKLVYLSPPLRGLRFGLSYTPEFEVNGSDPDLRRRVVQNDVVEAGAQYETPLADEWLLGASAALVRGNADPRTTRRDLSAWSTGVQLRRDSLVLGAAYVSNGDSSDLVVNDEREWNIGAAWREERWGAAASFAQVRSRLLDNRLVGIGGFRRLGEYVIVRADVVHVDERRPTSAGDGYVALLEVAVEL